MKILCSIALLLASATISYAGDSSHTDHNAQNSQPAGWEKGHNIAVTNQNGNGNHASIGQKGNHLVAAIAQEGDGFQKSIKQTGSNQGWGSVQNESVLTSAHITVQGGNPDTQVTVEFEAR